MDQITRMAQASASNVAPVVFKQHPGLSVAQPPSAVVAPLADQGKVIASAKEPSPATPAVETPSGPLVRTAATVVVTGQQTTTTGSGITPGQGSGNGNGHDNKNPPRPPPQSSA